MARSVQFAGIELLHKCRCKSHDSFAASPISGRTWRFVVMLDPLVDVFVSRDLDSAILDREVIKVKIEMH